MDKDIAEWNGKVVYYIIFAVIALVVVFLWVRFFRQQVRKSCDYCGRSLYKRPRFKDVVGGMPRTFCNRNCCNDYRENGPLPADERQVRRANELIDEAVR